MKGIFTTLTALLLFSILQLQAQNLTPPKDGAAIRLATNKIEVSPDKTYSANVWLVKSRRYATREFGGLETKAPEGVEISFETKDENKDVFSMKIKVSDEVKEGKYTLIIKGEGKNFQKVKSSVVSLIVGGDSVAGTGN